MTVSIKQHLDEIRTVKSGWAKRTHREEKSMLPSSERGGGILSTGRQNFIISLI
jgi:hypothetical protein